MMNASKSFITTIDKRVKKFSTSGRAICIFNLQRRTFKKISIEHERAVCEQKNMKNDRANLSDKFHRAF